MSANDNTPRGYFDFNDALPPLAERAASAVQPDELLRLFRGLERANALWVDPTKGERGAALAALVAVAEFLASNECNASGALSRPIDLLYLELLVSPAAALGNILPPWERGQAAERGRRPAVNYGKAAGAFAAHYLHQSGAPLKEATLSVAKLLNAHGFPLSDHAPGTSRRTVDDTAQKVRRWRESYLRQSNAAANFFKAFCARPPIPVAVDASSKRRESLVLEWLTRELQHIGYTARTRMQSARK